MLLKLAYCHRSNYKQLNHNVKSIIKYDYYKTDQNFCLAKCADEFQISEEIIH